MYPLKKSGFSQMLTKGKELSASNNTLTGLLIYTVKSGQSLGSDRSRKKVKDPFLFEIWIFRNGQPDRDGDPTIFVAITLT